MFRVNYLWTLPYRYNWDGTFEPILARIVTLSENGHNCSRTRRFLSHKAVLFQLRPAYTDRITQAYNHPHRKCLDYLTPEEFLAKQVLHLKCESTLRHFRE